VGHDRYEGLAERYGILPDRSARDDLAEFFREILSENGVHRVLDRFWPLLVSRRASS
jgi:hypothetical protein